MQFNWRKLLADFISSVISSHMIKKWRKSVCQMTFHFLFFISSLFSPFFIFCLSTLPCSTVFHDHATSLKLPPSLHTSTQLSIIYATLSLSLFSFLFLLSPFLYLSANRSSNSHHFTQSFSYTLNFWLHWNKPPLCWLISMSTSFLLICCIKTAA